MNIKSEYWDLLLRLKQSFLTATDVPSAIVITPDLKIIELNTNGFEANALAMVTFDQSAQSHSEFYKITFSAKATKAFRNALRLYSPYFFTHPNLDLPFVVVHQAQTIDGKVATESGQSKWIGNSANLTHSHRIRALCDAILVGGNTYRIDHPQLTVRHVPGENPIKLILTKSLDELDLPNEGKFIVCSSTDLSQHIKNKNVETIHILTSKQQIDTKNLLRELKSRQIRSILVEGGPQTIRCFVEDQTISRIEFHLAPILFGSGKNGIQLAPISEVSEAKKLHSVTYHQMGDSIMIVAEL